VGILSTNPGDLGAPVEQRLGADVVAVFTDVVEEAAERHQRRDEHHLGGETDGQDMDATRMKHRRHYTSFVEQTTVPPSPLLQHLDRHGDLHVLAFRVPEALYNHYNAI